MSVMFRKDTFEVKKTRFSVVPNMLTGKYVFENEVCVFFFLVRLGRVTQDCLI